MTNAGVLPRISGLDDFEMDDGAVEERRAALCSLLREQRAPFEERPGGELLILGCLHVSPPFLPRSCRCENATVLDRFLEMWEASGVMHGKGEACIKQCKGGSTKGAVR